MAAFQLPESDRPEQVTDRAGRLWRYMPGVTDEAEVDRIHENHKIARYETCPNVCYWYHDDHERGRRLITFDLPCAHRETLRSRRDTADLRDQITVDGVDYLADVDWRAEFSYRVASPYGAPRYGATSASLDIAAWRQLLEYFGWETDWCNPIPEHMLGELNAALLAENLYWNRRRYQRMGQTLKRPASSGRYRQLGTTISEQNQALEALGWTEEMIADGYVYWDTHIREDRDSRKAGQVSPGSVRLYEWRRNPNSVETPDSVVEEGVAELLGW